MLKQKALQIFTIIAALFLFSAYVVYSQLKQAGTIASSSKSLVLTNRGAPAAEGLKTNVTGASKKSTNTISPHRVVPADATNSASQGKKPEVFFPGSKSAAVFVPPAQATTK